MPERALRLSTVFAIILGLVSALQVQLGSAATNGAAIWNAGSLAGDDVGLAAEHSAAVDLGTATTGAKQTNGTGMYFRVADSYYPPATSPNAGPDVSVDVEYYDQGYASFYMIYDGLGEPNQAGTFRRSFGFQDSSGSTGTNYITNNIVYLQNTGTWKTYRFNLTNVLFAGGNYDTDFGIIMENNGSSSDPAIAGYRLLVRKVTVTKLASSSTRIDVTGRFSGNYGSTEAGLAKGGSNTDFGAPAWVWTRLGEVPEGGHGLYFDTAATTTNPVTGGGSTCKGITTACDKTAGRTGSSFFFNVNDNYIKDGKDLNGYVIPSVHLVVEYAGTGSGSWKVQYRNSSGVEVSTASISLDTGASTTFKRYSFYITDAYFGNNVSGNDFQVVASDGAQITVRDVIVARTAGEGANRTGTIPSDWSSTKKLVGAFYFPIHDGYRPTLWPDSTIVPTGYTGETYTTNPSFSCGVTAIDPATGGTAAGACDNNYVNTAYSMRSLATNTKDLTDAKNANIDFFIYSLAIGSLGDMNTQGTVGIKQAVAAASAISGAPRFAVMIDTVVQKSDALARTTTETVAGCATGSVGCLDMSNTDNQGLHAKQAVDFYSLVPRSMWATIDGKPIVVIYYQANDVVVGLSSDTTRKQVIDKVISEFQAAHGVAPWIIVDRSWETSSTAYNLRSSVNDYFNWGGFGGFGGSNCASESNPELCPATHAGAGQPSAFEVSPGAAKLHAGHGVIRYRYGGTTYQSGWDRAIDKGNHLVMIDTFNYFHEGSAISQTKEFGSAYLSSTATNAAAFKGKTNYSSSTSVNVDYSAGTNSRTGIANDNYDLTQPSTVGSSGLALSNLNAYFSIDDSFLWNNTGSASFDVTITYVNTGSFFDFKYDSQSYDGSDASLDAKKKRICNANTASDCNVVATGTAGGEQVARFTLIDLYAGNRLINTVGADFLVGTGSAGTLTIKKVQVARQASIPVPSLPVGWIRNFIPLGNRGAS